MDPKSVNDGGPAFPCGIPAGVPAGMTLRDYFAAHFMARAQSLCETNDGGWNEVNAAQCAYAMADAMLAARETA